MLGRKRRLKARSKQPHPTGESQWHNSPTEVSSRPPISSRGVKYDSEAYRQMVQAEAQQRNHELMYRGIKVERKFASKS